MISLKPVAFPSPVPARSAVIRSIDGAARVVEFVELSLDVFGVGAASPFLVQLQRPPATLCGADDRTECITARCAGFGDAKDGKNAMAGDPTVLQPGPGGEAEPSAIGFL